jgi:hypothetical protein
MFSILANSAYSVDNGMLKETYDLMLVRGFL